jgi:hypothetical protein
VTHGIVGYRENSGGDHRWHAQVVLANGSQVFVDVEETSAPTMLCHDGRAQSLKSASSIRSNLMAWLPPCHQAL